ncbi:MAG TPA: PA14 domain-containing protein [Planctomycetota bacterium]
MRLFFVPAFLSAAGAAIALAAPAPPSGAREDLRHAGELLLGELACTRCHAAAPQVEARLQPRRGPSLDAVGARLAPEWIQAFLRDPRAVRPGTNMPHMFAQFPPQAKAVLTEALTHFLVGQAGPMAADPTGVAPDWIESGRKLFHTAGCVACHLPQAPAAEFNPDLYGGGGVNPFAGGDDEDEDEPAAGAADPVWASPRLEFPELAAKWSLASLASFLTDPHQVRPDGRMPDFALAGGEARDLAAYLLREQAEDGPQPVPGLAWSRFQGDWQGETPDFAGLEPAGTGTSDRFALIEGGERFGMRYEGLVAIPQSGTWRFSTTSDDGSRLWIDGVLVVNNDGTHAMQERSGEVELAAGTHAIVVTMFEYSGGEGLAVHWEGPGIAKQEVPPAALSRLGLRYAAPTVPGFAVDPEQAAMGQALFVKFGCVECHAPDGALAGLAEPGRFPDLAALRLDDPEGNCLLPAPPPGVPDFQLQPAQRAALRAALADRPRLAEAQTAAELVADRMERLRCLACHERGGMGSPETERRAYFTIQDYGDLGDEGRIPPRLDGVGGKLRPAALARVLAGEEAVRTAMATRMPRFGAPRLEGLAEAFAEADSKPGDLDEPEFSEEIVAAGRWLVGQDGLACINCHGVGKLRSLGIPAVALDKAYARLRPGWFRQLLLDPDALNMNSRMPAFWWEGARHFPDVLDGDPHRQADAVWSYLSLGDAMPPPPGLEPDPSAFELVPTAEPYLFATFFAGVSPRTLCVGYPERLHVAFDREGVRLAKAWKGDFINAQGTWVGRAGALEVPSGSEVLDLPPGIAFAELAWRADGQLSRWPEPAPQRGALNARMLGYALDVAGVPGFRYAIDRRRGEQVVEFARITETDLPRLAAGGPRLLRRFHLTAAAAPPRLWLRAAVGETIEAVGEHEWLVDGRLHVRLEDPSATPRNVVLRTRPDAAGNEQQELLIATVLRKTAAGSVLHEDEFALELSW